MNEEDQIKLEEKQLKDGAKADIPLEEKSLKDLKQQATDLGFAGADVFNSKVQVISVITNLQATADKGALAVKDSTAKIIKKHRSKSQIMKAKLAAQDKLPIFLPLEGRERPGKVVVETGPDGKEIVKVAGATHPVTLNGYTTHVPKGVMTYVPAQVHAVLDESLGANRKAAIDTGKLLEDDSRKNIEVIRERLDMG